MEWDCLVSLFHFLFTACGTTCIHGSVAASRGCSFMNYFLQTRICHFRSFPKDAENKSCHCWPCKRQSGESPKHNLTFPHAEFNLQNAPVQLGGQFKVKVTYLWHSWQVLIFNLLHVTATGLLSRMSDPTSTCLQESLFFQTHVFWRHPNDLWNFLYILLSRQGYFPASIGQVHNSVQWKDSISNFISSL